jgi:uncharacterized protein (TIGR00369 family)
MLHPIKTSNRYLRTAGLNPVTITAMTEDPTETNSLEANAHKTGSVEAIASQVARSALDQHASQVARSALDQHESHSSRKNARPRMRLSSQQTGFSSHIGPFYEVQLATGMRRALALDARHLNPEGVVHGGVLSSFADFALYRAIGDEFGHELRFATVTLNLQYLAAAKSGIWLYGEGMVLRRTRDLIFASGELFTDERSVATASGVWKILAQA